MAREIVIEIDEKTGETSIEANGYKNVGGKCQGEEATKFVEDALGGVAGRQSKPDFQGGRSQRQNLGNRAQQR